MTVTGSVDNLGFKVATHQYETLRANALGNTNRATGFTLFLHNGMSGWLRALSEQNDSRQGVQSRASSALNASSANMLGIGLAYILADAILNGAARQLRGNT